jgi:ABC-type sugar transport system substrate-binding protein
MNRSAAVTANLLTAEGYREIGGVAGAISTTAENTFASLGAARQDAARRWLLRMIRVGDEDTPDTRRRVNSGELLVGFATRSDAEAALEAFADARLITKDRDTAAITHEALIRS